VLVEYQDPTQKVTDICNKFKISQALLNSWRTSAGIPVVARAWSVSNPRPYRPALSDDELEHLDAALQYGLSTGKSRSQIAKELDMSKRRIYKRARALGLEFPPSERMPPKQRKPAKIPDNDELDRVIREGNAAGKSINFIARESGYSFGQVQRRAARIGVKFTAKTSVQRTSRGSGVVDSPFAQAAIALAKKAGKRPANEAEQAVLTDYATGMPREDIFNKHPWLEHNPRRLDYLCTRYGVRRPEGYDRQKGAGTGRSMSAKQHEMILRMYKPGRTPVGRLADKVGLSYMAVRQFLIKQGIYKPVPSHLYSRKNQPKRK
jgi:transposase